ncbi:MAG: hypothetical protein PHV37_09825 [Candidatus Gastranaerophilales bacterium]|nr:hypothetical protein [Candidatus Gastranaerophilales bacterium]
MKRTLISILLITIMSPISALAVAFDYGTTSDGYKFVKHQHNEASYQNAWCSAHGGVTEYENKDFTRVDCLTSTNAVEFDFANKWAESIGQALHYQLMTGKRAKVVLILEYPQKQMVYYKRVKALAQKYNFDVEYVTPAILHLKNGQCSNPECKCHRK